MKNPLATIVEIRSYRPQRYKELTAHLPGNIRKACESVQAEAKKNVSQSGSNHPQVATGALRDGIAINIWRKPGLIRGYVGINRDLYYGRMLEHGTVNIPAYPWLYPALKARENEIRGLLR
jgi:hypothetical protein